VASLPAAYPFIDVTIDESGLIPVAQRSPGVIAIVGKAFAGATEVTTTAANTPVEIDLADDTTQFGKVTGGVVTTSTALRDSLLLALNQNPRPSKIYAVRTAESDYTSALAALEAADDIDFVALANEIDMTALGALKAHVENASASGNKMIGFAMIDPAHAKSTTYVTDIDAAVSALKSSAGRMVVMAARGATVDVASAAMAAVAGRAPQVSPVLKPIGGVTIPVASQYSPSEITGLSSKGINPVISPALMVGGGFYFADGRTYSSDAALQFIDIVRVLDDLDFKLKAGLVGSIGDDRITKSGLTLLLTRTEGILQPCVTAAEIDDFTIDIPLLDILIRPESTWSPGETATVNNARATRQVDLFVKVIYGPAIHQIRVRLAPSYS
jgi:hypothetical protein